MKHSLFIKSHSRDFPWLEYCRDSIRKFCLGWDEVVLCLPEGESFDWPEARIVHIRETFTGYLFQQAVKLYADQLCSGNFITFQDSDTVFTSPVTPDALMRDGKPIWITRPWDSARPDQQVWRGPTSKFIGQDAPFEGMYRHPFTTHRSVLQRMRGFCQFKHGVSLDEYIKQQEIPGSPTALTFSEWNALGAFAWFHAGNQFYWIDASKEEPPPAVCYQGFTWAGEQRKQEDLAKFREILSEHGTQGDPAAGLFSPSETLTEKLAIEFLASQVKDNFHKARIIRQLQLAWKGKGEPPRKKEVKVETPKKRGRPKGSKNKRTEVIAPSEEVLLCIHSYPGANETVSRHWEHYELSGADRIVGIGTDDGGCEFPCESVWIGKNAYMSLDRPDDHLCRRLLDTVKFCMNQPEQRFIIAEYDVLFLKKFPKFEGVCAYKTGGRINGSHAPAFYHGPWCFDKESGEKLIQAMEMALPLSDRYPNNSPDIFFGLACDMMGIDVKCPWKMFTRNSLDSPGDLELAVEAAEAGVHCIHGVKTPEEYNTISYALKQKHLALSHIA